MIIIQSGQFTGKLGKVIEVLPNDKLRIQIIKRGLGLITTVHKSKVSVIPNYEGMTR